MPHKMKTTTENSILAIYADDKKGILGHILMFLNRSDMEIYNLNVSRTDIREMVLITLEAAIPALKLHFIINKLRNIIEVQKVTAFSGADFHLNKIAFFKLSLNFMHTAGWSELQRFGAVVTEIGRGSLIVQKTGCDRDLDELYRVLDGAYLISYCKSGLIVTQSLLSLDEL